MLNKMLRDQRLYALKKQAIKQGAVHQSVMSQLFAVSEGASWWRTARCRFLESACLPFLMAGMFYGLAVYGSLDAGNAC